jgi:hypothetical protein
MKAAPNKAQSLKTAHNLISKHNCGKVNYSADLLTYRKRAKAKYSQNTLLRHLVKLNSPLKEKYEQSQFCSFTLIQSGHTFTARYCKQRWCKVCNRIRTGKLMRGYSDTIEAMSEPQFLTLTIPNVSGENLRDSIKEMTGKIQKIQDLRRKRKQPLIKAIRKLECTYNPDRDNYHPHFHFIIESKEQAEQLKAAWIERNPEALEYLQDIRPAHNPIELFKYFAKLTSKSSKDTQILKDGKKSREEWHYPKALDLIFTAIQGMRIIQPMGGVKMVSDEIEEIESVENVESANDTALWMWHKVGTDKDRYTYDWVNTFTGELLTGYEPTEKEYNYQKRIRYLQT